MMNLKKSRIYWYLKRKRRKKNISHKGYSQYGQDISCLELLQEIDSGIFIDIGANDGLNGSNSLLFEKKGWQGICVEPHPHIFAKLKDVRDCDCLNACITDKDGRADFLAVHGAANMLSGIESYMDQRHLKRINKEIAKKGGSTERIEIEALSPSTLIDRFSLSKIDFLSVDTEGCELPILKSFLSESIGPKPKVISVENGSRTSALFEYLTTVSYKLYKCVGCDEIYLKD